MLNRSSVANACGLPLELVVQRALQEPERVDVLDLHLDAQCRLTHCPHGDIGVAAQAALFHVAIVHADRQEDGAEPLEALCRISTGPQVRLGNDLDERHAAPVEIKVGLSIRIWEPFVERLPSVLFQMHPNDAYPTLDAVDAIVEAALSRQRLLILGYLIPLRQVWIEVVLAREDRGALDRAAEGKRSSDRILDRALVEYWERPRQAQTNGADMRVGGGAECRAAPAKELGLSEKLRVDFEADDGFVLHRWKLVSLEIRNLGSVFGMRETDREVAVPNPESQIPGPIRLAVQPP